MQGSAVLDMHGVKYIIAVVVVVGSLYIVWSKLDIPKGISHTNSPAVTSESASSLRALKERWKNSIQKDGAEDSYTAFKSEASKLDSVSAHAESHAFGEALYELKGLEGLSTCDSSFEFGCYHSFFGLAVSAEGIGTLPKFDQACKTKYGDRNLPCQHGIGHGILVYTDYNLVKALELCETISTLPTGGCSSGVFMEYNFHSMAENADGSYLREKSENLYEPCDTLPTRFQASCYVEQVQWWQGIEKGDFKIIGHLCAALPVHSDVYEACYHGVGNYGATQVSSEFEGTIKICALMPNEESEALCHEGASWLIRGQEGKEQDAHKLCDVLHEPYRSSCAKKLQN